MLSIRIGFRTATALVLVAAALGTGVNGQQPSGVAGDTMVGVQDLAWSSDGRTLFFSAMRVKRDYSDYTPDKWSVWRYDLATQHLALFAASSFSVSPSPTPGRTVVGKLVAKNRDLFVLDDGGRELARLTTDPAEDFGASWSPDGRRLAFTSKRDGHAEVYVANADGTDPRRLTQHASYRSLNPSWSPDGRHIAYYFETGDGQDQIHVMRPDGSEILNVTKDTFNNVFPGWTPDGRLIYGQSVKGKPTTRVFTVDRDGKNKEPFLNLDSFYARVSPDETRVAFIADAGAAGGNIVIVDRMGATQITLDLSGIGR